MSVVAPSQTARQQYARVLRHFASTRGVEVCALQASPLLGAYLGGLGLQEGNVSRLGLLLLGSTAADGARLPLQRLGGLQQGRARSAAGEPGHQRLRHQPRPDRARRDRPVDPGLRRVRCARHVGGALRHRDRHPQPAVFAFAESRQEHADRGIAQPPDRRSAALPARLLGGSPRGRERRRPQPRLRLGVRRRASQPGGARLRVRPRQRDRDRRRDVRMQARLPRELLSVHDRVSADRRSGRAWSSAEDPARERHRCGCCRRDGRFRRCGVVWDPRRRCGSSAGTGCSSRWSVSRCSSDEQTRSGASGLLASARKRVLPLR